jgi:hypothetical protein
MDNKSDAHLRKILKNWSNRLRPPDNGRARLLWEAARMPRSKFETFLLLFRPLSKSSPSSQSNDWSQTLFTWINENSFQYHIQVRLC